MIIYKIVNLINGKVYIGKTVNSIDDRWDKHVYDCNKGDKKYLYQSIRKYGVKNFKIEKICECDNVEQLNRTEISFIRKYDSMNNEKGYNKSFGGDGGAISPECYTDEVRKKMSDSAKKRIKRFGSNT